MEEQGGNGVTLNDLIPFIGCSELDDGLVQLLKSAGANISSSLKKRVRSQGMDGIELLAKGLALTFNEREDYINTYAEPKDDGEAILVAVFAYTSGKRFNPYMGPIPFTKGPVVNRNDALRELGTPHRTEEEDGVIEWDQWIKDGFQMRARYRDDASVKIISFTVPFK
jgi:hypothetical protein